MKDVSRKIYTEDVILLNEIETTLLRNDVRISQKDLIDRSIKFALSQKTKFLRYVVEKKKNDNTEDLVRQFLNTPKKNFGRDFLEEIDTTM
ncbi:hypothetical protein HYX10_03290 [Candidatus Woesearchaeota archaeon]|nr:hypothetical protein [Candidatus Woesearchaeota archaeon]